MKSFESLIEAYGLQPHPEGGFFRETYRAEESIARSALPARFQGDRSFATAIYYLLPRGAMSRLHRIAADEIWHFYLGGPLVVAEISEDGKFRETVLGQDAGRGELLQYVVRAGNWFGAYPAQGTEYSFVGCTVAPGFDFADFEMAKRADLLASFPRAKSLIERLTDT